MSRQTADEAARELATNLAEEFRLLREENARLTLALSDAKRDGAGELTGCCTVCGAAVTVESGPVNNVICHHVASTCYCPGATHNLWFNRVPTSSETKP